jgi:predicted nucleotidyltransferase
MITDKQKKIIIDTMLPYKPTYIGIFGSYARDDNTDSSDIDILYLLDDCSLFELARIQISLEKKLEKKIDLVSKKYIKPRLREYILNDVKMIYGVN